MTAQLKSSFHIALEKVPQISSIAAFGIGCIVLAGWQFDLPALTSILPGMAANSAVGFILLGTSLWLRRCENPNGQMDIALPTSIYRSCSQAQGVSNE